MDVRRIKSKKMGKKDQEDKKKKIQEEENTRGQEDY